MKESAFILHLSSFQSVVLHEIHQQQILAAVGKGVDGDEIGEGRAASVEQLHAIFVRRLNDVIGQEEFVAARAVFLFASGESKL
jgi:hypothetical protein